ncbi:MAG: CHAT domain-containing protein [Candidatus Aminicenantes bacterium]|nr:CHAT domain-containing protein [Candidatus Aminicenantes bacterium]
MSNQRKNMKDVFDERFNRYQIEELKMLEKTPEQANSYDNRFNGDTVVWLLKANCPNEVAVKYDGRFTGKSVFKLFVAGVSPETANHYNSRFDKTEIMNLYKAGILPEVANSMHSERFRMDDVIKLFKEKCPLEIAEQYHYRLSAWDICQLHKVKCYPADADTYDSKFNGFYIAGFFENEISPDTATLYNKNQFKFSGRDIVKLMGAGCGPEIANDYVRFSGEEIASLYKLGCVPRIANEFRERFKFEEIIELIRLNCSFGEVNQYSSEKFNGKQVVDLVKAGCGPDIANEYEQFNCEEIISLYKMGCVPGTANEFRERFKFEEIIELIRLNCSFEEVNQYSSERFNGEQVVCLVKAGCNPGTANQYDERFSGQDVIYLVESKINPELVQQYDSLLKGPEIAILYYLEYTPQKIAGLDHRYKQTIYTAAGRIVEDFVQSGKSIVFDFELAAASPTAVTLLKDGKVYQYSTDGDVGKNCDTCQKLEKQNGVGISNAEKNRINENIKFVLSQVSPDIENRNMTDVLSLAEAALVSIGSTNERLDLWGQALDGAYRQDPITEGIEQWVSTGWKLAKQQLTSRIRELNLDVGLVESDPLSAINSVYEYGSELYGRYKLEAFRVAQLYYYYFSHIVIERTKKEEADKFRVYSIGIGVKVVGFAYSAGCYYECIALAKNIFERVFEKMNHDVFLFFPEEIREETHNCLYWIFQSAARAGKKIKRFPDALDWSIRAESFVSSLGKDKARMKSDCFVNKGEILLELSRIEEASGCFEKALQVPGLTPREVKDKKREIETINAEIIGDFAMAIDVAFTGLLSKEDRETIKGVYQSAVIGDIQAKDISLATKIIEKALSKDSLEKLRRDTAMEKYPAELAKFRGQLAPLFARAALSDEDFTTAESFIPGIEKLATGDTPDQLDAALLLVRYRINKGESVTWESISSIVSRIFGLPRIEILNHLLELTAIILDLDDQELEKAATAVAALVNEIIFDSEEVVTPTAVVQESAIGMGTIDLFLMLLVKMTGIENSDTDWLGNVSRLKCLCSYRGQRKQKEAELYRYTSELPEAATRQVKEETESLARHSLEIAEKRSPDVKEKELELMTLLYPLFSRTRSNRDVQTYDIHYPEIVHIETASYLLTAAYEAPIVSVVLANNGSQIHYPGDEISRTDARDYLEFLKRPVYLDYVVEIGLKLKEALLMIAGDDELPYLMGVRSTGVYHRIPLEALPLAIDKERKKITRWVGEELTSVLLTGQNKDMEILEEPFTIKSIAVFANSFFGDKFPGLPGTVKEAEAIVGVFREAGNRCASLFEMNKIFPGSAGKKELPADPPVTGELSSDAQPKATFNRWGYSRLRNWMKEGPNFFAVTDASIELFLEHESNRENFLQLSGEKAPQVLHIATHGITYEDNPSSSFIALSGENSQGEHILGAVGYHDIILMDLRGCELVVLSACSTHEGKSILGEGVMGLAWAFKAAGAKAIIATRWQVADEVGVVFWRKFYENLCDRLSIGEAFHDARQHIIRQEKWRHPFYWGVFQLIV